MKTSTSTKAVLLAAGLTALFPCGLRALPTMPVDFKPASNDATGKTWRETGELKMPLAMGLVTLKSAMTAQGYSLKHDISDAKSSGHHLFLWKKGDEEIIMSVWEKTISTTGCSWGVSLKEGQSDNKKTAKPAVKPKENKENGKQN